MLHNVQSEMQLLSTEDLVTIVSRTSDSSRTLNVEKKRIVDEAVVVGGRRLFAAETALLKQGGLKVQGDRNRLTLSAVAALASADDSDSTSYMFWSTMVNARIELHVTILLYWRVLLDVPIAVLDFANPALLTHVQIFDWIRDVVAVAHVISKGAQWTDLDWLGKDGNGGGGGADDDDDDDDDDDRRRARRGAKKRVRMQRNGKFASAPQVPVAIVTPSKKQAEHAALALQLCCCTLLSCKVDNVGGGVAVFHDVGGARVFKVFAAAREAVVREAAHEVAMHKLLTVCAGGAVMPLLSVTHDKLRETHGGLRNGLRGDLYWDVFHKADEVIVLETECADGARLDWAALAGAELARRGEQLLAAVASLAARNVVHGDVKPDNIVVHRDVVLLIDFGLTVEVDMFSGRSARVVACGTRGYMAPEVAAVRDSERKDRTMRLTLAVDVFSAGRVLAHAAEGAAAACEPLGRLVARMMAKAAADRPTARAALDEWRREVAPALEQRRLKVKDVPDENSGAFKKSAGKLRQPLQRVSSPNK
jgi:hypothetical protein